LANVTEPAQAVQEPIFQHIALSVTVSAGLLQPHFPLALSTTDRCSNCATEDTLRRNYRSLAAAFCHRTPLAHQFEAAFEHGTVVLHFILVPAAADTNRKRTFDNRSSEATSANRLSPA
jgi:hypothetical protein